MHVHFLSLAGLHIKGGSYIKHCRAKDMIVSVEGMETHEKDTLVLGRLDKKVFSATSGWKSLATKSVCSFFLLNTFFFISFVLHRCGVVFHHHHHYRHRQAPWLHRQVHH